MIVLGEKVNVPYNIDNMRKAFSQLTQTRSEYADCELEPNTLYIRFLPKDTDEFLFLEKEYGLTVFDHPLNYEIEVEGSYYHDPSIPEDRITWQYTIVDYGFDFPSGIRYEILEEAYIPEYTGDQQPTRSGRSNSFEQELEYLAFQLCGYEHLMDAEVAEAATRGIFDKAVNPAGTLSVRDNVLTVDNDKPLAGIKVSVKWWYNISSTHTARDGSYRIPRAYQCHPSYYLSFSNNIHHFQVYGNYATLIPAVHDLGTRSRYGYTTTFTSGNGWYWGSVNEAAVSYWDECGSVLGVPQPLPNTKIYCIDVVGGSSSAPMLSRIDASLSVNLSQLDVWLKGYLKVNVKHIRSLMPDITIARNTSSREIFGSVNHELAHASHFRQVGAAYWTEYVRYILKLFNEGDPDTYGNRNTPGNGICGVGEMWGYAIEEYNKYRRYTGNVPGLNPISYQGRTDWFRPEIIWNLIERSVLTPSEIFFCLTVNVRTHVQLREKMVFRDSYRQADIENEFRTNGFMSPKNPYGTSDNEFTTGVTLIP